ncbi:MAG: SURF1 family protein [Phyllobacterium sp.]
MTYAGEKKSGNAFPWLVLVFGLGAMAVLLALGTWQVQRLHWKEGLLATIEQRTHQPPESLARIEALFAEKAEVDYWPVTVSGEFLHDRESYFFATHRGMSGYYVYTPLQLQDGREILINRGFVPYDLKDPALRAKGQVTGTVTLTGLARNPVFEKPSSLVPDNEPGKNLYYWKDWSSMASKASVDRERVLPFFIDADATANPGGLPAGGVTIIDLTNNHLQYAVTWYGLAAALAGVLGVYLWRSRNAGKTA